MKAAAAGPGEPFKFQNRGVMTTEHLNQSVYRRRGPGRQLGEEGCCIPCGERVAALEQWLWGWPRGRDPVRNPWGGVEGEERWVAVQCHHPPGGVSTAPEKCQLHRESGLEPLAGGWGLSAMITLRPAGSPGVQRQHRGPRQWLPIRSRRRKGGGTGSGKQPGGSPGLGGRPRLCL